MTDTGEQGLAPDDPKDRAGVGGGIVPDDQVDGYEQAAELAQHPTDGTSSDDSGDARS